MFAASKTAGAAGGAPIDPYFYDVSLLLNGDSVGGTANSYLSDASTNNFQLTPNGLPGNSGVNPFQAGYYSNSFNGSSSLRGGSSISTGAGDYTVECWANMPSPSSNTNGNIFITIGDEQTGTGCCFYQYNNSVRMYGAVLSGAPRMNVSYTFSPNVWYHIAFVRSGITTTAYVNGVSIGTATVSGVGFAFSGNPYVSEILDTGNFYKGDACYISNLRVTQSALYTSNFTPSTTPLTAISGVQFLTSQSNRFIDNSSNNVALTVSGSPVVSQNQPFTYTAPVTYGSGYFNGSSTSLNCGSQSAYAFGTGDFTVEAWIFPTSWNSYQSIIDTRASDGSVTGWDFGVNTGNLFVYNAGFVLTGGTSVTLNAWNHVAFVRNGSAINAYLNGVSVSSNTTSSNFTDSTAYIGANPFANAQNFIGYISNTRLVKGTALYTSSFTPPTAPLTAVSNTSLLTVQNNVPAQNNTFLDSSNNQFTITRNGNTTQGSFSPYGNLWSNYFNGSSSLSIASSNTVLPTGTQDFSVEMWINWGTQSQSYPQLICNPTTNGFQIYYDVANGQLDVGIFNVANVLTYSIAQSTLAGVWTHVAVTRSGNTFRLFVNGVLQANGTNTISYASPTTQYIGSDGSRPYVGYLSNVRTVLGAIPTAYQTSSTTNGTTVFTPSTSPLTAVTSTALLTCQSNRFIDNSVNNYTITANGSPSVQRFSPFNPTAPYNTATIGGSGYFDGASYLQTPSNSAFNFSATDCTIEFWYYGSASGGLAFEWGTGASGDMQIEMSGGSMTFGPSGGASKTSYALNTNAWNHLAAVKSGSTYYLYINGTRNTTSSGTAASSSTTVNIGGRSGGSVYITGYLSNIRISNTAVYTGTTLTVPTAPVGTTANTQLLLNVTNAGIPDLAMQNDLQTVGSAQVSTSVKKYGTGSISFSGSGSGITASSSPVYAFGTGQYTVECWIYFNSVTNIGEFLCCTTTGNSGCFTLYYSSGVGLQAVATGGAGATTGSWSPSANTWYHIAASRDASNNQRLFVNGTLIATSTSTNNYGQNGFTAVLGNSLNGYMDDIRITNGYCRYTSSFTPPTAALPTY